MRTGIVEPQADGERVPLAVWPCAQATARQQLAGRYLPATADHPDAMLPELARRAIVEYSTAGDTVFDPMCGAGTVVAEAARLARNAVGREPDPRWAAVATANLDRARRALPAGHAAGEVHAGDTRASGMLASLAGRVGLILTQPPSPAAALVGPPAGAGPPASAPASGDPAVAPAGGGADARPYHGAHGTGIGRLRGQHSLEALAAEYARWAALLAPHGRLVIVAGQAADGGDPVGATVTLCQQAGLGYLQHVIALTAPITAGQLRPQSRTRQAGARAAPGRTSVHRDVLVFASRHRRQPPAGRGRR